MKLPELTLEQLKDDREELAYALMTQTRVDKRDAVDSVDPDWVDHYSDINNAFNDYWEHSKEEMIRALVENLK